MAVLAGILATGALGAGVLTVPPPYVVLEPGPTVDTLGAHDGKAVIEVGGVPASVSAGQLRLTTVGVETRPGPVELVEAWFDDRAVAPRELVYPPGKTAEQVEAGNAAAFTKSQTSAETAAFAELGYPPGTTPPFTVKIQVAEDIGGPSAGLMFALGIVDKLRPADLTGGRIIAGTGAIDDAGAVGPIGGIPQKLRGARAAGATYFLVPADNCAEALRNPVPGLTLAKVASLRDGLAALSAIAAGSTPPPCA